VKRILVSKDLGTMELSYYFQRMNMEERLKKRNCKVEGYKHYNEIW